MIMPGRFTVDLDNVRVEMIMAESVGMLVGMNMPAVFDDPADQVTTEYQQHDPDDKFEHVGYLGRNQGICIYNDPTHHQ